MAPTLHIISAEATSRQRQPRHETQNLRLKRRLPDGSPWCQRHLSVRCPCWKRQYPRNALVLYPSRATQSDFRKTPKMLEILQRTTEKGVELK